MKPIFSLNYFLDSKAVEKAVVEWHFGVSRVKNIVYTVILGLLAVNFLISAILSGDAVSYIIVAACVISILMVIFLPSFQAKPLARAYGEGADFTLNIFENKIEIVSQSGANEFEFEGIVGVLDGKNFYCFELQGRFFPVPKASADKALQTEISEFLAQKLEKRYKNLNKK